MLNETEIRNYADDTKIYCSHQELQEVTIRLENDTAKLSTWFAGNFMKLIEEKCHFLVFGEKDTKVSIKAGSSVIKESNEEKLLGVILDRKLNFKSICLRFAIRQVRNCMLLQGLRCICRKKKLR